MDVHGDSMHALRVVDLAYMNAVSGQERLERLLESERVYASEIAAFPECSANYVRCMNRITRYEAEMAYGKEHVERLTEARAKALENVRIFIATNAGEGEEKVNVNVNVNV